MLYKCGATYHTIPVIMSMVPLMDKRYTDSSSINGVTAVGLLVNRWL